MSMRFLHIKRAYVVDPTYSFEVDRDAALNISLLDRVYGEGNSHDICAITEEGEWLIHGRKINPEIVLKLYDICFVYIHSPSDVYDRVRHACSAYAQKSVLIYKATDALLHHAEKLEGLVKLNKLKAKIAHQIHIDMKEHNENFTPSEIIAGKHIRNVFLPVQVMSSGYRTHIPESHIHKLADNFEELAEHIDSLRHSSGRITLRSHIVGDSVFVVALPKFRNVSVYTTMPLISKKTQGKIHFHESQFPLKITTEISEVVRDVSRILFPKIPTVFELKIHGKRGVFIHNTSPFYFFLLHNQDFLFEIASTHAVKVEDMFLIALKS